eukprot:gene8508-biopygen4213
MSTRHPFCDSRSRSTVRRLSAASQRVCGMGVHCRHPAPQLLQPQRYNQSMSSEGMSSPNGVHFLATKHIHLPLSSRINLELESKSPAGQDVNTIMA